MKAAGDYLTQLCKHCAHRLPATFTESAGRITFRSSGCTLRTEDTTLVLRVVASDAAALAGLLDVVARHLLRFAFRKPPKIHWTPAT
jgi:hypothetical protein